MLENIKENKAVLNNDPNRLIKPKFGDALDFDAKEAYNLLRTNISFLVPDKQGVGKVIGVTSSCPQEGKSFSSVNLSYALAKDGKKVLLIDGDMRKPTIAKNLQLDEDKGLSNILAGQLEPVFNKVTLHKNITVITSGVIPPNPSELIGSEKMKETLEEFSKQFDYIILDLPPVNSVADGIIVSKYLDGLILVVKHGYSRKKEIMEAVRQLNFAKAHLLGVVYNGYRREREYYYKKRKYYYYSKYSSHYYKRDDKNSQKSVEEGEK